MAFEMRGAIATLTALMIVAAGLVPVATAQSSYPAQPIRLLITNPPGGLPDTVARLYAKSLETRLKQSVIVENRPGANGTVAVAAMMTADADGYTLVVTDGAIYSVNPFLYPNLPYSETSLKPISLLARAPLFLAVHPKVGVRTLAAFVEHARANPGKLNYGSSGVGSLHHLAMVALASALKLDMVHVPFKGTGESVPALLGGHVDILFSAYPSLSGAAEGKQVIFLAASTIKRSPLAPNLPSVSDVVPEYDYAALIGAYGRAEISPTIVNRLASEFAQIAKEAEVVRVLAAGGAEAVGSDPDAHQVALHGEATRVRNLVQSTGLKLR